MNLNYILNGNLIKVWTKFVSASVVGVILSTIYTMVDGIFVGQGAGEAGLAGVNLAWPAVTIILGIGLLFGAGASSLVSIYIGQHNQDKAEQILGSVIKAILYVGIILMILGFVIADPIVKFLGATPDTYQYTKDYFLVIYMMAIPYLLANALNPLVRADGSPNLSMIMVGAGAIGNIVLDWLFVIELGWGTKGAALATGAGVILSTIIGLCYFLGGKSHLKLKREYFKINSSLLKEVIKVGFVSFMIQLSIGVVILLQNKIIYRYGNTADIAIFSVAGYTISLYIQLCVGISQGMQPLIGYHFGADSIKRMHKLLKITLIASIIIGIVLLTCLIYYGEYFIQLFGITPDLLPLAYKRTVIFCLGSPFIGIVYTMGAYYQSIHRNLEANIVSIGRSFVLQILFSILLPIYMGVEGIFYAQPFSDICSIFILGGVMLYSYIKYNNPID
ncbi:MAG: MATE family efflux transporter [Cellulosilyticaceae bacterium]|uniref:MATE family efflux transporter n=1 Tax=Niameybacter sp. TaxID=2033640 RepID=UPI002FCA4404